MTPAVPCGATAARFAIEKQQVEQEEHQCGAVAAGVSESG
jgi:hypothetical protein